MHQGLRVFPCCVLLGEGVSARLRELASKSSGSQGARFSQPTAHFFWPSLNTVAKVSLSSQCLVIAAIALLSAAGTLADHPAPSSYHQPSYPDVVPVYNYDWNVYNEYANNNYGHTETRNDKVTTGSYTVALPDGRTQKVTYTVDGYGGEITVALLSHLNIVRLMWLSITSCMFLLHCSLCIIHAC